MKVLSGKLAGLDRLLSLGKGKGKGGRKGKFPQKINPLLFYLLAGALAFFAYTRTVVPLQGEIALLEGELRTLDVEHVSEARARLEQTRRELEGAKAELERQLRATPTSPEAVQSFLYESARRIGLSSLSLEGMEPHKATVPAVGGVEVSYHFRGTFDQVLTFFRLLQEGGFRNKEMRITPYLEKGQRLLVVQGRLLLLRFQEGATPGEGEETGAPAGQSEEALPGR